MTEEEYFIKNYPDFCYGDKPLSPHWDFFQDGVEFGERQPEEKIQELEQKLEQTEKDLADYQFNYPTIKEMQKENAELKEINIHTLSQLNLDNGELIVENEKLKKENAELKNRNAELKGMYAHSAREAGTYKQFFEQKEKENAELKSEKGCESCTKFDEVQLTKAKELLERLLITSCNSDVLNLLPNCSEVLRVRVEAEQFLNSEVEK